MVKQIIVIRKDLGMRRGKEIVTCSHASMAFLVNNPDRINDILQSQTYKSWVDNNYTKICLQVSSLEDLLAVARLADEVGVECHIKEDIGATEFSEPTITCLALGPDQDEKLRSITKYLKLY